MRIEFRPWDAIEIKSAATYTSLEDFLEAVTAAVPPGMAGGMAISWAHGVLFRFQPLAGGQGSDELTRSFLKGKLIWESIDAVSMPKFQADLRPPSKPMFTVRVQDVSRSSLLSPVAKWLASSLLSKPRRRRN